MEERSPDFFVAYAPVPDASPGCPIPTIMMLDCKCLLLCPLFPDSTRATMLLDHLKGPKRGERVQTMAYREHLLRFVKEGLGDQNDAVAPMAASNAILWPVLLRVKDASDREAAVAYVGDYWDTYRQ